MHPLETWVQNVHLSSGLEMGLQSGKRYQAITHYMRQMWAKNFESRTSKKKRHKCLGLTHEKVTPHDSW